MNTLKQPAVLPEIAADVLDGLTRSPKSLPPWLFYDQQGSELFEQITRLPEYYLTRTELCILERCAPEIVEAAGASLTVVELGAGTASKTRALLREVMRRQLRTVYYPVDVSASALGIAAEELERELPNLHVQPLNMKNAAAFLRLPLLPGAKLVLFIGSSIGNFDFAHAVDWLRLLSARLSPRDALLLGTDLAKDPAWLIPAYDDPQGVTERFNKNMLARINRELDGDFDLERFRHVAEWNPDQSRIEIFLESRCDQAVRIGLLDLEINFAAGERIHTENSYKYTPAMVRGMLERGGFRLERTWTDPLGWFAVHLARPRN
jgi:L-histidine N-alpha-methyltransferase